MSHGTKIPSAFVSYSWDNEKHREWIRQLAARLRGDGVDVTLDQWHTAPGDQLPLFMERAIRENDFVLIICTPQYKNRSDARLGGVGYEGDIMTAEALTGHNERKFIPLLRSSEWKESAASWLAGKYYIDLRGDPFREEKYQELLNTLHGRRPVAPPIGKPPDMSSVSESAVIVASSQGPDWRTYVAGLVNEYEKDAYLNEFVELRKFDSMVSEGKQKKKIGLSDLDSYVNEWLGREDARHLAVLGGYGSGKTWYCHRLTYSLAKAYLRNAATTVPILIPLRLFSEASDVAAVLELFWDHAGRGDFTLFKQSVFQGDALVILDGFDEMSTDFREQARSSNFGRLRQFFAQRSKVIITSRDTYFGHYVEERELLNSPVTNPLDTGLIPRAHKSAMTVIYLDGFNSDDIQRYFSVRLGTTEGKQAFRHVMATYDLPDLASRPILANLIATTWPYLKAEVETVSAASVYGTYSRLWLERESWRLQDINLVNSFMQQIAVDLRIKDVTTIPSEAFSSRIQDHFRRSVTDDASAQDTERRIKNCAFLTRDGSGAWSFIHRSFMEFFCAQKCYEDFLAGTVDFTDSFPLSEPQVSALSQFLNVLMRTARLPQARWAFASQPSQVADFFADMLIANGKLNDFGEFLIRSRVTVWGYKFFEEPRLNKLIGQKILERLESDFEWDYYLKNKDWYRVPQPSSPNRIKYVDQP